MNQPTRLALAGLAALALAACSGGLDPSSDGGPPPRPVVIDASPGRSIPAAVEDVDYRIVRELPATIGGGTFRYGPVADDRTAVGVQYPSADGPADEPPPDRLLSVDLRTGDSSVMSAGDTTGGLTDITEVSRGDGFLVWLQSAPDGYDSLTWELHSYEVATRTERRIASSSELGIDDPPWPSFESIRPQIAGDRVYWAAVERVRGSAVDTAIYSVPLDGASPMTKVIDDATDVYADDDNLWFQRDGQMMAWDVSSGTRTKVDTAGIRRPCGGFFHEGTVVQIDCAGRGSLVITERSGRRTTLRGVDHPGYLNATSRWVGYSVDEQAYVYDLRRQRLMRLEGAQGGSAQDLSGNRMFYIRQHSGAPDDPDEPTYPYIALLPE